MVAVFETPAGSEVWLPWLIPIHTREVRFIMEQGASAFEDMLEREDPDLLSLRRLAISAAGLEASCPRPGIDSRKRQGLRDVHSTAARRRACRPKTPWHQPLAR